MIVVARPPGPRQAAWRSAGSSAARSHGIEELAFAQPAVLVDHALLKEGHDRQARPERECPSLEEEDPEGDQRVGVGARCGEDSLRVDRKQQRQRPESRPRWPRIEQHADETGDNEEDRDLGPSNEGDRCDRHEDRPEPPIALHGHAEQLPGPAEDQRDDRRPDPVEERLDEGGLAERDVERRDDAHDEEWRQDERHRGCDRSPKPAPHVAEPHRELRRERPWQCLRHREAFEVLVLRDPAATLDEVTLHVAGERYGSAEAEGAEA